MASLLSNEELDQAFRAVPNWKYDAAAKRLVRATKRQSFLDGIDLVRDIAELAGGDRDFTALPAETVTLQRWQAETVTSACCRPRP